MKKSLFTAFLLLACLIAAEACDRSFNKEIPKAQYHEAVAAVKKHCNKWIKDYDIIIFLENMNGDKCAEFEDPEYHAKCEMTYSKNSGACSCTSKNKNH